MLRRGEELKLTPIHRLPGHPPSLRCVRPEHKSLLIPEGVASLNISRDRVDYLFVVEHFGPPPGAVGDEGQDCGR